MDDLVDRIARELCPQAFAIGGTTQAREYAVAKAKAIIPIVYEDAAKMLEASEDWADYEAGCGLAEAVQIIRSRSMTIVGES